MVAAAKPIRLADLAAELGREWIGDGAILVTGVAPLESAGRGDLSFVRGVRYAGMLAASQAGAVIVPLDVDPGGRPAIRSANPSGDFARAVDHLVPQRVAMAGISPHAVVAEDAEVDPSASVGAGVVVGPRCQVGSGSVLHANVTLYPDVSIGAGCILHSGVVVREECELHDRVTLQPGVVVGGDGFGYVGDGRGALQKVRQLGRVVIEDDVEIGANTTIDRATLAETRIRRGAKLDNLVQIAHNCDVGEDAVLIAQTGLGGTTRVGRGAMLMARVGAAGHLHIGEGAFVGARTGLHKDVPAGARVFGTPQMEGRTWHRAMAALARLPDLVRRVRNVERELAERSRSETGDR